MNGSNKSSAATRNPGYRLSLVAASRCVRVAFILPERFSLTAFSTALDALDTSAELDGIDYQISCWSMPGGPVRSDVGVNLDTHAIVPGHWHHDVLVVVGGHRVKLAPDPALSRVLRSAAADRVVVCGLWNGAFQLAQAGLLHGRPCVSHPDSGGPIKEYHPALALGSTGHVLSGRVGTCAEASAALGLMLEVRALISQGRPLVDAGAVKRLHQPEQIAALQPARALPRPLSAAIALMEEHIEEPLDIDQIAGRIGVSRRQLERRFARYLQAPPVRYYLELRLARARQLIVNSDRSLTDVALATGFISYPHFYRRFKDLFGLPPMEFRDTHSPQFRRPQATPALAMN
ncbi:MULTISPECIES: GlxA family transcriptional regulator [unclassified Pseudomonas]|uniref:GlxA family transcriptional regulator n=1 Tax=unclassified Pseudomonas TaxID=196821 RepID=UPI000BD0C66E|nr:MULTISPECIES: helix-turn-helix domain-containing protein [unclassified Pseudomonas]PVZ11275.1 transcriptional regulator GlxA family with amidase domain [Pseudomonas sp. URIL14HWK12:I12]PVZ22273.1 transcriptional regulator GlxA family with amidase domain [Pseudomonas sp. URIL14HWK12:I10]PVZ31603.1 transcriptional regulator GlxA family with amidase domain [Pseudomonas sp. URIL14HWK12:I11]SNZ16619.1 Transcriptional regulator GlxA family, contains an amidase domain and an AraC-type DNA-binding H